MHEKLTENVVDMLDVVEVPTTLEERLEIAAMVTRGLEQKLEAQRVVTGEITERWNEQKAIQRDLREFMARIALKLARIGGEDHRTKNEVILSVVADLLSVSSNPVANPPQHYGDIPF